MASRRIPDFVQKLRLLHAHAGLDQKDVAAAVSVKPQTLNTWINGAPGKREREEVPHDGREALAALLVQRSRRPLNQDSARDAWMGPVDAFARLFIADSRELFLDLFAESRRRNLLRYLENGFPERGLVSTPYTAHSQPDRVSWTGDMFAIEIRAPPKAWGAAFVETPVGIHLLGPDRAGAVVPDSGALRIPARSLPLFVFRDPEGPHRILGVMIVGGPPPQILDLVAREGPLPDDQLAGFAEAIRSDRSVDNWATDQISIDVRRRT